MVYNDPDTREALFAVNARDGSNAMTITGHRCVDECDLEPVPDEDEDEPTGLWSDPATWGNREYRVPEEGEEVVIDDNMSVIYDIGTSPVFKSIEINGKLTLQRGQPALIQAYGVWVRAGELNIGTEEHPFDSTAEIRLHGNNTSPSQFVFSPNVPVGSKHLIITGQANMFGTPRDRVTRLLATAYPR